MAPRPRSARPTCRSTSTVTAAGYDTGARAIALSEHRHGRRARQGPGRGRVLPELRAASARPRTPRTEPAPTPLPPPPERRLRRRQIGLRTFEEIIATMSVMTGVPTTNTAVDGDLQPRARAAADGREHRGLPVLAPGRHGPARDRVLQRAGGRPGLRAAYFPGFNFGARGRHGLRHAGATRADHRPADRARSRHGTSTTQPSAAEITAEVDALIGRLTSLRRRLRVRIARSSSSSRPVRRSSAAPVRCCNEVLAKMRRKSRRGTLHPDAPLLPARTIRGR